MNWAIVATFVGIGVTAVLGAITAAHEQSPMKQLERVTALLKDTPSDAAERRQLTWLRDELSRRVNEQYRAPTDRYGLGLGSVIGIYGAGLVVFLFPILINLWTKDWTPPQNLSVGVQSLMYGALLVGGGVLAAFGRKTLKLRNLRRRQWVAEHDDTENSRARI